MIYRYKDPKAFEDFIKPNFRQYSGDIVLWGAGKIGSVVAHRLKQEGIAFIAYCDTDASKHGKMFSEHRIVSPDVLYSDYPNAVVIITTQASLQVRKLLSSRPTERIFDAWPLLLDVDFDSYTAYDFLYISRMIDYYLQTMLRNYGAEKKYIAQRLRIVITSKCSLRCKECSMLTPYISARRDAEWEKIVGESLTLVEAVGHFEELGLYGGEVFMHHDVDKVINGLSIEDRFDMLTLATNGTIVPNELVVQAMKNEPRINVKITNYGRLSSMFNELVSLLDRNDIRYEIIEYRNWYKSSVIGMYDEPEEKLKEKFNFCMSGCGIMLWDGKVFLCGTLPFLSEINVLPESEDDYFDMRNKSVPQKELMKEIYKYIDRANTDNYISACKYCSGKSTANFLNIVPVAEQVKGVLPLEKIAL